MEQIIKDYCITTYGKFYDREFARLSANSGAITEAKEHEYEIAAQKYAIMHTIMDGMTRFQGQAAILWHSIYEAHVYRKSGVRDLSVIRNVISADQSWKKSSGHAFEEMIKILATEAMGKSPIEFVLQKDLNILIKAGEIANEPRDISWLKEQIKGNIFDLYAIVTRQGKKYCFGCVQCKTSIRDRVTRDREPSIHAMESCFWSVIFVLDGDYLKNPKFQFMVNGGSREFPKNGWHAMYDVSQSINIGRIYPLELDFKTLRKHSRKAAEDWLKRRQWFKNDWNPE
ncbi:MAG: BsaWI family type II restriction enzyme [Bacteroides sp.]|nr:BsaWI family type II restriction enzyme [Bacteroides sp.]